MTWPIPASWCMVRLSSTKIVATPLPTPPDSELAGNLSASTLREYVTFRSPITSSRDRGSYTCRGGLACQIGSCTSSCVSECMNQTKTETNRRFFNGYRFISDEIRDLNQHKNTSSKFPATLWTSQKIISFVILKTITLSSLLAWIF